MKKYTLFISSYLISIYAFAGSNLLFDDVPINKSERLSAYNRTFLDSVTYLASRYRIVSVNENLLIQQEKEFYINPFDDILIPVSTKSTLTNHQVGSVRWTGKIQGLGETEEIIENLSKNKNDRFPVEPIIKAITEISLFTLYWDVNENSGDASLKMNRKEGSLSPLDNQGKENFKLKKDAFRSVQGTINYMGVTYIIKPLKYTPKYQVIYELDNSKTYSVSDTRTTDNLSPQDKERAKRHNESLKNLTKDDKEKKIKGDI